MKTQAIKSSSRTKAEPACYRKKVERWVDQRNAMIEAAGLNRDVQPEDSRELADAMHKIATVSAKVRWALSMIPVAMRMEDELRLAVDCPECGERAGCPCGRDAASSPILCFGRRAAK